MTRTLDRIAERGAHERKLRVVSIEARSYFVAARMMCLADAAHWLNGGDVGSARAALREAADFRRNMARAQRYMDARREVAA